MRHIIDHINLDNGRAGTAARAFKRLGQFFVEATLRAIFEEDAAKGRQHSRRELGIQGVELLTERQLEDLLHIRHGLRGVQPLMQSLRRHHCLGVMLPEDVTEPS